MRQKSSTLLIYFSFVVLCFQSFVFAQSISEADYPYPYKDPYLATASIFIMQGSEKPPTSKIWDQRIKILDHRDDIPLLEGKGTLRYRFYQQKGLAPLVFIIPGLSGSAYVGTARYVAEWLADHGFHVLIIPSPLNWNFALAASVSGYPGYTLDDTKDLYSAMRLVLDDVKTSRHAEIGKIGMLGFSDGALYTGYISKMDSEQKRIGIDRYLLINPPLNLLDAARKIDQMAKIGKGYSKDKKFDLEAYAFGEGMEAMKNNIDDPAYFANWNKRLGLNDQEIEYLIGKNINDSVGDAVYVIDIEKNEKVLKTQVSWKFRSARIKEARSYGLMGYVQKFLIPHLRKTGQKGMDIKTLGAVDSLRDIGPILQKNQTAFLMHNQDDIFVSKSDVAYLNKLFGDRATIYPYGGHLGNLWYSENKKHILDVFKPLFQHEE
jgi:hypothetical protein